jgi:hypothetical protein
VSDNNAPWLAEARPQNKGSGKRARSSISRRSFFLTLAGGLTLLAAVVVGAFLLISRQEQNSGEGYMEASQAPLITAEPGPWKIKPEDPMGLDVEGQDQTLYAAGIGIDEASRIDTAAVPEAPLPRPGTAAAFEPATNLLPPAMQTDKEAPAPAPAPDRAAAVVPPPQPAPAAESAQLGAFSSRERAEAAWAALVKAHGLIGSTPVYVPLERDGKTLIRLRARGGDAKAICARLAKTGDPCSVVPS